MVALDPLPDTRPADSAPAIYEVTQGGRFEPRLEAFDNLGVIKKFELVDFPAPNINRFVAGNSHSEANSYEPRFNGNIPANTAPGVYMGTIKVSDGVTGDKTYYFKYKVLPAAPTITPTTGFGNDLSSTERSISGTGIAGATVKIDLQGKTVETTVGSDGNWTYNLKNNEVLTQNFMQNANTKSTKPVSVKQVMHGIESTDTTANVQLSDVITFDEPLQAGRDITLRVPHDAGRFYVIIASKEGHSFQYGINKTANGWQVEESVNNRPTGKTTTELTVSTTSNPAERVFKLHIKDSNQKTDIPFTMKADARSVMARVHYDNSRGNPASGGNWTYTTR